VKSLRQNMLEKAAHELLAGEGTGSVAVGGPIAVAKGDAGVADTEDASVGDGDAEGVAGEIFERLGALAPGRDMDDPGPAPNAVRQVDVRATLGAGIAEAGADQLPQCLGGEQESLPSWVPGGAVVRQAARGDQAMGMRMEGELLRPGVQHRQHADGAPDPLRIASQFDDGFGSGLHHGAVAGGLVAAQGGSQLLGDGHGDEEVRNGQDLGLALFEPSLGPLTVALSAVAILAGMEDGNQGAALGAAPQVAAERLGPARDDVGDGATMGG
jgi:hypothetical protein